MKQLHIREPWADLALKSTDKVLEDLLTRVQVLEAKVRELETRAEKEAPEPQIAPREAIPVRTRSAVPVGV